MTIRRYKLSDEKNWENLLYRCKNPAFVLSRKFISYHEDKFEDFSIVIYTDNILIAAIPACKIKKVWHAHPGLPFADIMICDMFHWVKIRDILNLLKHFLLNEGFEHAIFKIMPDIYKGMLSDDMLYFLRDLGANLHEQKLTTAIPLFNYQNVKKNVINKSKQNKRSFIFDSQEIDIADVYDLMKSYIFQKYQAIPIHSLVQLQKIMELFPQNVRCIAAYHDHKLKGGMFLFVYEKVVKVQYIFSSEQYLADILLLKAVEIYLSSHEYLDLGTSNSLPNNQINYGNLDFKAKNGGKACIVESYILPLNSVD